MEAPQQINKLPQQYPQQYPQNIPKQYPQQLPPPPQQQQQQQPIIKPQFGNQVDVSKLSEEEQLQFAINLSIKEEEEKKKLQKQTSSPVQQQQIYPKITDDNNLKFFEQPKVPKFEDLQPQHHQIDFKPVEVIKPIEQVVNNNTVEQVKPIEQQLFNKPVEQQLFVNKPVAVVDDKYAVHQGILANMGFKDTEKNAKLLEKHGGNLQKVVGELLY